jgi:hypothetical protein
VKPAKGFEGATAMSWIDIVGYSAALAVLAAFCMSSIVPLRIVAILSNVLFALYGLSAHTVSSQTDAESILGARLDQFLEKVKSLQTDTGLYAVRS